MIRKLSPKAWEKRAKKILLDIFLTYPLNPCQPSLKANNMLTERLILFGFNYSFSASKYQYEFIEALKAIGEKGFYASITEATPEHPLGQIETYHWYIPMSDAVDYGRKIVSLEKATYSKSGQWGMLFSQEEYAVLACSPQLLKELEKRIPNLHTQVYEFLWLMKSYQIDYKVFHEWLEPLLLHVYGEEKGAELYRYYQELNPELGGEGSPF